MCIRDSDKAGGWRGHRDAQDAHIGFLFRIGQCIGIVIRCQQNFDELAIQNGLAGGAIQRAIEGEDAAECGCWIGGVGRFAAIRAAATHRHAARVGVLDEPAGRQLELAHAFPRGIGIGNVVVAELLAL